jgi:hypothetical protein
MGQLLGLHPLMHHPQIDSNACYLDRVLEELYYSPVRCFESL